MNVDSDDILGSLRGTMQPETSSHDQQSDGFGGIENIDPEMDPELAMALRMSLEEERARQERLQEEEAAIKVEEESRTENTRDLNVTHTEEMSQEIADLMMNNVGTFARKNSRIHHVSEAEEIDDEEDQAALMQALELSMAQPELEQVTPPNEELEGVIDEELLNQIMEGLPGVNISEVRKNMKEDKDKK